jgi:hypothetical protein
MNPEPHNLRVLLRGVEAGGITRADIERRASELALIRTGREEFSDADLAAAARELAGEYTPAATTEDDNSETAVARDPGEPRSIPGHQVAENPATPDENTAPERLALQGVEEAQHDQMVAARRPRRRRKER